jgi:nucleoside recognition membrane protein YjiH
MIILLMASIIVLLLAIVACETYAMSYPKDNFSKWWRKNIMQLENDNNDRL